MTAPIDLESLRAVLAVLDYETRTIPIDSRDYGPQREIDVADLQGARDKVAEALAELTARRARDAEVESALREHFIAVCRSNETGTTDPDNVGMRAALVMVND